MAVPVAAVVCGQDDHGLAFQRRAVRDHMQDVSDLRIHGLQRGCVDAGGIGRPAGTVPGRIRILVVDECEIKRRGLHLVGEVGGQRGGRNAGDDLVVVDLVPAVVRARAVRGATGGAERLLEQAELGLARPDARAQPMVMRNVKAAGNVRALLGRERVRGPRIAIGRPVVARRAVDPAAGHHRHMVRKRDSKVRIVPGVERTGPFSLEPLECGQLGRKARLQQRRDVRRTHAVHADDDNVLRVAVFRRGGCGEGYGTRRQKNGCSAKGTRSNAVHSMAPD